MGFFNDLMSNLFGENSPGRRAARKGNNYNARGTARTPASSRNRSNKAASARYSGQAALYKKNKASMPTRGKTQKSNMTGRATGGSGGGGGGGGDYSDGGGGGSDPMADVMNQIANMTTPTVEIPQIDIGRTLAGLFDPQFKAIANQVTRTKKEGKQNTKEIDAAYEALERSISKDDAKEIDKSYKAASKDNTKTGEAVSDSMAKAMSAQAAERRKDAQNLGIESALGQDSGAQTELAKGITDANKSTQSQNQRLSELKKADQALNRDAAQTAEFTGNENISALKGQVAEVLAGLGNRRLDTQAARANKRYELETQNQNAVNAGRSQQAEEAEKMMQAQVDLIKNAQDMSLDEAKLKSKADIEEAKLRNKRYEVDAKYANRGESKEDKDVLSQLAAMSPGGLGTKSLQGVISNMDSFYASGKGTWSDAYKQYAKTYSKSERSKSAAREYLRMMGKR